MESKQEKLVVIVNESVIGGLVKDVGTFALFAGLLYFNHKVLSGSLLVDVLFILMVMFFLIGKSSRRVFKGSKQEAIKWLEGHK